MSKGLDTEKGFTLLEVMIAVSILSGVVLSIIVSLNYHISAAARNRDLVVASMLGGSLEGEIRASGLPEAREGSFGEFPGFAWRLDIKDAEWGLRRVDLKVQKDGKDVFDIITYRKRE